MSNQLLINCRPDQRRVAHIENGVTTELFFERVRAQGLVGNIYKGRVVRVLPGMQCAFLELGLQRTAFLYVGDVYDSDVPGIDLGARHASQPDSYPPINELLKAGQELLVQVTKEPIGSKGARVTTQIGLPGRFVVFRPNTEHVGVSRRIVDEEERERLWELAARLKPAHGGLIVRTVGEGLGEEDFTSDLASLASVWGEIQSRIPTASAPALLHEDLDLTLRSVRDLLGSGLDRVLVDDPEEAERIRAFVERTMPNFQGQVETWDKPGPMFERFGLEWEISRAVRRKVWLRSGGSICLDRTEALVAIDVNTGRYVGSSSFEETAYEINLEAAREIAYQLRFRDIGGLIVIDFIDMANKGHRDRVRDELVKALEPDKARSHVLPMSELGLIEMTRKRVRESIVQSLTEPCFYCDGRGYLRAVEIVVDSVLSRLGQLLASGASGVLRVRVHPKVMESLIENCKEVLARIQEEHDVQIEILAQEDLHLEKVEIG
ncbi:MAG: Rne/Rng family ribonuclease [Myxococcota bacterium]|nr:Rne/Rng family ribonuclease [Myxococcota bacterium]